MKPCKHKWIKIAFEMSGNLHVGDWHWCFLCGATKHFVYQVDYFGLKDNGIYIRLVGKDKKAKLYRKW